MPKYCHIETMAHHKVKYGSISQNNNRPEIKEHITNIETEH